MIITKDSSAVRNAVKKEMRKPSGHAPNNEHLEKSLKIVLDNVCVHYKQSSVDIVTFQMSILKTYLWVSSVLVAAEMSTFKALIEKSVDISFFKTPPSSCFYIFAATALLVSLFCFCLGVDSLRGRGRTSMPFGNAQEWIDFVFAATHKPNTTIATLETAIQSFDSAVTNHNTTIQTLSIKLKIMSWSLLASLGFGILAMFSYAWS